MTPKGSLGLTVDQSIFGAKINPQNFFSTKSSQGLLRAQKRSSWIIQKMPGLTSHAKLLGLSGAPKGNKKSHPDWCTKTKMSYLNSFLCRFLWSPLLIGEKMFGGFLLIILFLRLLPDQRYFLN